MAFAVGYAVFIVSVVTMLMSRGPIAMMEVLLGLGSMVVLFVAGRWTSRPHVVSSLPPGEQSLVDTGLRRRHAPC